MQSYTHIIKINPKYAVSYYHYPDRSAPKRSPFSKSLRKCNAILSHKAKQNLRNCFQWLQIISNLKTVYSKKENKTFKFKLSFITLTLSDVQKHSDDYIKSHLLEPFLKWMGRSHQANSYIWKAEVQNNGNIHFHITTNKFIHWKSVRAKWNNLLSKHDYCKVYQDGTNDKGSCATEIKAVRNEKQIANYIVNYVSKKDLFKKIKDYSTKKVTYINSESCELNNHFYVRENFRQVSCCDGTSREYKRQIHGRIWSASTNLNQSAIVISELNGAYEPCKDVVYDSRITDTKDFDFHKIHLYKRKIYNLLPISVRDDFRAKVSQLIIDDVKQTKVFVDSLY